MKLARFVLFGFIFFVLFCSFLSAQEKVNRDPSFDLHQPELFKDGETLTNAIAELS